MKEFYETAAVCLWIAIVLVLLFLFNGTPDLWDKMHGAAMDYYSSKGIGK